MDKLSFNSDSVNTPFRDSRLEKLEADDIRGFFVLADNVTEMLNTFKKFDYLTSVKFDLPVDHDNLDLNTLVDYLCSECPQLTRDGSTFNIRLDCDNQHLKLVPAQISSNNIGYSLIDEDSSESDKANQDKRWKADSNQQPINWYPIPIKSKHSLYHVFVDSRENSPGILFTMIKYNPDVKDLEDECDCGICTGELLLKMMNNGNDTDSEFSDSDSNSDSDS